MRLLGGLVVAVSALCVAAEFYIDDQTVDCVDYITCKSKTGLKTITNCYNKKTPKNKNHAFDVISRALKRNNLPELSSGDHSYDDAQQHYCNFTDAQRHQLFRDTVILLFLDDRKLCDAKSKIDDCVNYNGYLNCLADEVDKDEGKKKCPRPTSNDQQLGDQQAGGQQAGGQQAGGQQAGGQQAGGQQSGDQQVYQPPGIINIGLIPPRRPVGSVQAVRQN